MTDMVLAASAVVLDAHGRVLLVQRGEEPEKGRWSVPGGSVPSGDGRQYEIHDFLATATSGILTPGDDADDARWVAPDEMHALPP